MLRVDDTTDPAVNGGMLDPAGLGEGGSRDARDSAVKCVALRNWLTPETADAASLTCTSLPACEALSPISEEATDALHGSPKPAKMPPSDGAPAAFGTASGPGNLLAAFFASA